MNEIKVGERVTITLEVVKRSMQNSCNNCFFNRKGDCYARYFDFDCSMLFRSDENNVIFKEVKE